MSLDQETVDLVKVHGKGQIADRLAAGQAWQANDLIFCQPDGTPIPPDRLTNRFKAIAAKAGLPV